MDWSTHDGMEVGLREFLIDIHFIKVPIWAKDNVHVIQANDLLPKGRPEGMRGEYNEDFQSTNQSREDRRIPTFLCLRK